MKNAIKKYLENECKEDKALAEVYDESKLDECVSFIVDQVRRMSKNESCAYDDATVFGWARHFFQDGPVNVDDVEPALMIDNVKVNKEKAVHADIDVETIKQEAAEKAVAAYKEAEKAKAEAEKAAKKAARAKAEAERIKLKNFINPDQIDMFAEAV